MSDQRGWRPWLRKHRWYERNRGLRGRWRLNRLAAAGGFYIRHPIEGEIAEGLRSGRLRIGEGSMLEPGVWITMAAEAQIRLGEGVFLNRNVMLAAQERIEIGAHTMLANGCFVGDADHRYDDPELPITWQGFVARGPVTIGESCWLGANVVVTGGVEIGDRAVIGANSVVTQSIPGGVIAAGAPAKVIREIRFITPQSNSSS